MTSSAFVRFVPAIDITALAALGLVAVRAVIRASRRWSSRG
ncbi:hypothetical protein ACWEOW_14195 [Monashia sp. NPDC004114]